MPAEAELSAVSLWTSYSRSSLRGSDSFPRRETSLDFTVFAWSQHSTALAERSCSVAGLACSMTTCSKNLMIRTRDCVVTSRRKLLQTLPISKYSCLQTPAHLLSP